MNENDEVQRYQMGRYISSNEAVWKILDFPVHERYPTVTHLAVHLENGQRVFFNDGNAEERAQTPPRPLLWHFFCSVKPMISQRRYCIASCHDTTPGRPTSHGSVDHEELQCQIILALSPMMLWVA